MRKLIYTKDPSGAKYPLLINRHKSVGLRHCNDCKVLTEYSNDMDDIYENIDEYNPNKELKNIDYIRWYGYWYA